MKAQIKPYQLGRRLGSGVKMVVTDFSMYYGVGESRTSLKSTGDVFDFDIVDLPNKVKYGEVSRGVNWLEYVTLHSKPALRPKSHITLPITHNGETFVPVEEMERLTGINQYWYVWEELEMGMAVNELISKMPYKVIQWLIAHNFHIDELQGTWISVDELETNPYEN